MSQYYPSEPWNYEYETARVKQSVTSVIRNLQQRKECENRRKNQKVPRVRETVNETLSTSCSRFSYHDRSTKKFSADPTNRQRPQPQPPQHTWSARERGHDDRHHRATPRQKSNPGNRVGYSRGRKEESTGTRVLTHKPEGTRVTKQTSLSPREPACRSTNAGRTKPRGDTKEQSRPQAPLQIDDQRKKQSPPVPPVNRKRFWRHDTRNLTPDSDEDDSDEEEPSTKLSRYPNSDDESITKFQASPNHGDGDPKNTQSCSSGSSSSSSGTDTTNSSSSEDETEAQPQASSSAVSAAQRKQSPHFDSMVPLGDCKTEHSPQEPKRAQHFGDSTTHSQSSMFGKNSNSSRVQGQVSCHKEIKSVSRVENTQNTAVCYVKTKPTKEPTQCKPKVSPSTPKQQKTLKQRNPPASKPSPKPKAREGKLTEFKKPVGRSTKAKNPKACNEKHAVGTAQRCEPETLEDHAIVEHTEPENADVSYSCATLLQMCKDLNEIAIPENIPTDEATETAQAIASVSCSNQDWVDQLDVWEEVSMDAREESARPLLATTTKDMHDKCESDQNTVRGRQRYSPVKPEEIECKTSNQMPIDTLYEENIVDFEFLNTDLSTLSAAATQQPRCTTSPHAFSQQQISSVHPMPVDVQM